MPQPGTPAALMPPGEDFLIRAIQEMDRKRLEDQAALAQSFQGTVAQLQAAQAALAAQQAALTSLVNTQLSSAAESSSADGMAFGSTEAAVYTGPTLSIPAIYTNVVVMCIAGIRATNTTGSAIYLFGRPRIESSTGAWATGATLQTAISSGWQGTISSPEVYRFAFPGTAGQSLTFKAMGWTSTAVGATASNFAGYSYIALMSRT